MPPDRAVRGAIAPDASSAAANAWPRARRASTRLDVVHLKLDHPLRFAAADVAPGASASAQLRVHRSAAPGPELHVLGRSSSGRRGTSNARSAILVLDEAACVTSSSRARSEEKSDRRRRARRDCGVARAIGVNRRLCARAIEATRPIATSRPQSQTPSTRPSVQRRRRSRGHTKRTSSMIAKFLSARHGPPASAGRSRDAGSRASADCADRQRRAMNSHRVPTRFAPTGGWRPRSARRCIRRREPNIVPIAPLLR